MVGCSKYHRRFTFNLRRALPFACCLHHQSTWIEAALKLLLLVVFRFEASSWLFSTFNIDNLVGVVLMGEMVVLVWWRRRFGDIRGFRVSVIRWSRCTSLVELLLSDYSLLRGLLNCFHILLLLSQLRRCWLRCCLVLRRIKGCFLFDRSRLSWHLSR